MTTITPTKFSSAEIADMTEIKAPSGERDGWQLAIDKCKNTILDYPLSDIAQLHSNQAVVANVCDNLFGAIRKLTPPPETRAAGVTEEEIARTIHNEISAASSTWASLTDQDLRLYRGAAKAILALPHNPAAPGAK